MATARVAAEQRTVAVLQVVGLVGVIGPHRLRVVVEAADALHRERYLAVEMIYIEEVDPLSQVEVIVDNPDFDRPLVRRPT